MSEPLSSITSVFTLSDEAAMLRVKEANDHNAFALLMRRWEKPIRRLCTRMIGDEHRGEDLAQDTFARLFQKRASYVPTAKFSTYLWRVSLNLCYDELRRRKRQWENEFEQLEDKGGLREGLPVDDETPHTMAADREEADLVKIALGKLPESYRVVLILRHYEGLKLREIADVLDIPPGTVNSRMAEALTRLSKSLAPVLARRRSQAGQTAFATREEPVFNEEISPSVT